MRALVTGGGGFLGRYIVEQLLARGDQVRSFSRGAHPELTALGVEVIRGDVTDREATTAACAGVECVLHTAAVAGISMRRQLFDRANRLGAENVLEACKKQGVARLVYTSSPSVAFSGGDQQSVDEQTPPDLAWLERHRCYYSLSKAMAESSVLGANDPRNLKTVALRPHLVWGPRDNHLIPRLIARARSGKLRRVGDGANLVDVTYVENAAAAHVLAAEALAESESPVAGRAYFISQSEPVNCWQWIDQVLALAKLPPVAKSISFHAAWRMGTAFETAYRALRFDGEPPMSRFLAAQLAKSHWFDISAARRDFGYEPTVSTSEGMHRLGAWLQSPR